MLIEASALPLSETANFCEVCISHWSLKGILEDWDGLVKHCVIRHRQRSFGLMQQSQLTTRQWRRLYDKGGRCPGKAWWDDVKDDVVLDYYFLFSVKIITCHSLVRAKRAKGEVLVLLYVFCSFFCQLFLDNPQANSRQILHAGVLWFRMCFLPFWGLAAPGGRKKGEIKFLWKTYVECEWRVCVSSTDALVCLFIWLVLTCRERMNRVEQTEKEH